MNCEYCQKCKKPYLSIWGAPWQLWNKVTGRLDGRGLFCMNCFDKIAMKKGIELHWNVHERKPTIKYTVSKGKIKLQKVNLEGEKKEDRMGTDIPKENMGIGRLLVHAKR